MRKSFALFVAMLLCLPMIQAAIKVHTIGFIAYSPLAQGLLTERYLEGIPSDSRMAKDHFLHPYSRTPKLLDYLHEQLETNLQVI